VLLSRTEINVNHVSPFSILPSSTTAAYLSHSYVYSLSFPVCSSECEDTDSAIRYFVSLSF